MVESDPQPFGGRAVPTTGARVTTPQAPQSPGRGQGTGGQDGLPSTSGGGRGITP